MTSILFLLTRGDGATIMVQFHVEQSSSLTRVDLLGAVDRAVRNVINARASSSFSPSSSSSTASSSSSSSSSSSPPQLPLPPSVATSHAALFRSLSSMSLSAPQHPLHSAGTRARMVRSESLSGASSSSSSSSSASAVRNPRDIEQPLTRSASSSSSILASSSSSSASSSSSSSSTPLYNPPSPLPAPPPLASFARSNSAPSIAPSPPPVLPPLEEDLSSTITTNFNEFLRDSIRHTLSQREAEDEADRTMFAAATENATSEQSPPARPSHDESITISDEAEEPDASSSSSSSAAADENNGERPIHRGVTCDSCGMSPIIGVRWKCRSCDNFDFCDACHTRNPSLLTHSSSHTFREFRQPRADPIERSLEHFMLLALMSGLTSVRVIGGSDEEMQRALSLSFATATHHVGSLPATNAAKEALQHIIVRGSSSHLCVVCQECLADSDEATLMPCSHIFHSLCIMSWLDKHSECPVCRAAIQAVDSNDPVLLAERQQSNGADGSNPSNTSPRSEPDSNSNP